MEDKYNIKPKPTFYNGILYRSRLEARWAVFFDFIRLDYEYEPEPFNTWSPDFVIHSLDCFVEVKPYGLWDDVIDKIKPYSFNHKCLLLADEILVEHNKWHLGKRIIYNNKLDLVDFTLPYFNGFDDIIISRLWKESKNKVMYFNPLNI